MKLWFSQSDNCQVSSALLQLMNTIKDLSMRWYSNPNRKVSVSMKEPLYDIGARKYGHRATNITQGANRICQGATKHWAMWTLLYQLGYTQYGYVQVRCQNEFGLGHYISRHKYWYYWRTYKAYDEYQTTFRMTMEGSSITYTLSSTY